MQEALDRAAAASPWPLGMRARASSPGYEIEFLSDGQALSALSAALPCAGSATLFQSPSWLACWYRSVGASQRAEPMLVRICEHGTGLPVMTLPLIRIRSGNLRVIEFADLGVTDTNAPILGPGAPATRSDAKALWKEIVKALPDADLARFKKMPGTVAGRVNPLALLPHTYPSPAQGFSVTLPDDWGAYLSSLSKKFRKELGRSLRLFEKAGDTSFRRIESPVEARRVLAAMDRQQLARLKEVGARTSLDEDTYRAFYQRLVEDGIERGTTLLTALIAGDDVIAGLLGISDGKSFAMLRLSHESGGEWTKIGLGRTIIERSMQMLHARGLRRFEFGIGDYPYKAGFGVAAQPIYDLVLPLSWRGRVRGAPEIAKASIKRGLDAAGLRLVPKSVKERYRRYRTGKKSAIAQEP